MINITSKLALDMSGTNRLLCQEMLHRGWKVQIPYWYTSHFYIDRGDRKKNLHIYNSSAPTLSRAAAGVADDKYAASRVLHANGIEQLPTLLISGESNDQAQVFMNEHHMVVVKPLDGAHGNGITTRITSLSKLEHAIEKARKSSNTGKVLLQKQLQGKDLKDVRLLVIDGEYIGAIHRIPARVVGDGKLTVEQLIIEENQQAYRGEPYKNKLAVIDVESAKLFLGDTAQTIPQKDEIVTVRGVANYGAGGELADVTDIVPHWIKDEAIHIASILELPVAGIDYMLTGDIASASASDEHRATVIEVNKSPSLCIHDEPTVGKSRGATQAYVDYIDSL